MQKRRCCRITSLASILFFIAGCVHQSPKQQAATTVALTANKVEATAAPYAAIDNSHANGHAVVIWVSVDGLRYDYVQRYQPPFLTKLQQEGAFTTALVPIFPSITFPSHTAEATGTTVDHHGIAANSFYDTDLKQQFQMSDASSLLQSEPIWITAARQHVRAAMGDWPFSYQQAGPVRSEYFGQRFETSMTDEARLVHLSKIWADDVTGATTQPAHAQPLQLIMGYVADVDHAGHRYGPEARETGEAVRATDSILAQFWSRCVAQFDATHGPDDELYFMITTDHGMSPVSVLVNLERLLSDVYQPTFRIVTSGNLANVYLDQLPADQRDAAANRIVDKLKSNDFLEAWTRATLPARYAYNNPTRSGDVVVSLKKGYSFSSQRLAATRPANGCPMGMHGYDVNQNPDMLGYAVIWRYRHRIGGEDLGRIDSLRLHPTVAKILSIDPAPNAKAPPIELPAH